MAAAVDPAAPLSFATKLSYGLGETAEGVKTAALETFLFFYYVQVVGLPGSLAGLALLLAVLFDAVSDPLIGNLSDNLRTRIGRRHPFLYAAPVPLAVSILLLFTPPATLDETGLFLWLLGFAAASRLMQSLYFVPHMALGADLTTDYGDRVVVSSYRNVFAYGGRLLMLIAAFSLFFDAAPGIPNGQLNPSAYPPFALACGIVAGAAILLSALGTQRRATQMHRSAAPSLRVQSGSLAGNMASAFRLPAFTIFFVANLISYVLSGVQAALGIHLMTYYWRLPPENIKWVLSAIVLGVIAGSLLVRPLAERWDKRPVLIGSVIISVMIATLPIVLAELGVLPTDDKARLASTLFAVNFCAGVSGGAALVLPGAMLADIADAYEHRFGARAEGFLYGASAFTRKAALGIGGAAAGITLDLIAFPRAVPVDAVPRAAAAELAILYGPGMLAVTLVAMAIMWRYPLNRQAHAAILHDLAERRRAAVSAAPLAAHPLAPGAAGTSHAGQQ